LTRQTAHLDCMFAPSSIAVIGASSDPARIGGRPIAYMLRAGFPGALYPINPERSEVQGLRSYRSIDEVPGPVDLAVIAVKADAVLDSARTCAARGVRCLVVFSAGFAESGTEGREKQRLLTELGTQTGMRINGPNSLGLFNANTRAFPTFSVSVEHCMPRGGRVGIASQSGGYGGYVLKLADERGLDIGNLITTGNECDVEIGEAIHWLAEDPGTDIILAYMEGCRTGAKLMAGLGAARRAGKPVVVIKVGRTEVGAKAAASHTAALVGSDHTFELVFREYGAYRAQHTQEMLDIACALKTGKLPPNRSIGLVTVSGGIGVHMSDLAAQAGLTLPPLTAAAAEQIRAIVPFAATGNPLDVTGQVANDPQVLQRSLEIMLRSSNYGSTLVFLGHAGSVPSLEARLNAAMELVAAAFPDRLIACCTTSKIPLSPEARVLQFPDPPRAISALAACAHFAEARWKQVAPLFPAGDVTLRADWSRRYNEYEAKELLKCAGVAVPLEYFVRDAQEVPAAAAAVGGPVALKIVSPDLLHKSDVGGVALGIFSPTRAGEIASEMLHAVSKATPTARIDGFLVSEMVNGVECLIGVHPDPVFGPVLVLGAGGIAVELLQDVTRRLVPVGPEEADAMIRELRTFALLDGYRGKPKADLAALGQAIVRISELAYANADRIEVFEVNPLIVRAAGEGAVALDCVLTTRAPP